jgi:transposase
MPKNLSLLTNNENLQAESESLRLQLSREREIVELLRQEIDWLKEQLLELKRSKFGRKSERWESEEQLLLVFNEAEALETKAEEAVDEDDNKKPGIVKEHERKSRGHRKPLPESLEREIVKIELPPEEQVAKDGSPLKVIGWEISEKFKYEPSKVSVIQYHRAKYGVDSGDYEKTAPPVPSIIPKGVATPELLAAIVVAKYADGTPLYRVEDIFKRQDIELGRTTMARWVIKTAEACQPIWNVLSDKWRDSFYGSCDETKVQVLKENGRKAESKSWMLVRATPFGDKKIVLFDYSTSRGSEALSDLIIGFKGYLQVDGLNSYDQISKQTDITRLGCSMHARRRFEQAATFGAKTGKSFGEFGLGYYKTLYEVEETLRGKTISDRYEERLKQSKPIWDEMLEWANVNRCKVPIKSKIGNAFAYFINEFEYLTGYLKDGRLEIDNGFVERAIRKFAIGRNGWLFSDQVEGAHASAVLYSLVITAKINGVNPYRSLVKLFTDIPNAKSIEDYERLAELILTP